MIGYLKEGRQKEMTVQIFGLKSCLKEVFSRAHQEEKVFENGKILIEKLEKAIKNEDDNQVVRDVQLVIHKIKELELNEKVAVRATEASCYSEYYPEGCTAWIDTWESYQVRTRWDFENHRPVLRWTGRPDMFHGWSGATYEF